MDVVVIIVNLLHSHGEVGSNSSESLENSNFFFPNIHLPIFEQSPLKRRSRSITHFTQIPKTYMVSQIIPWKLPPFQTLSKLLPFLLNTQKIVQLKWHVIHTSPFETHCDEFLFHSTGSLSPHWSHTTYDKAHGVLTSSNSLRKNSKTFQINVSDEKGTSKPRMGRWMASYNRPVSAVPLTSLSSTVPETMSSSLPCPKVITNRFGPNNYCCDTIGNREMYQPLHRTQWILCNFNWNLNGKRGWPWKKGKYIHI